MQFGKGGRRDHTTAPPELAGRRGGGHPARLVRVDRRRRPAPSRTSSPRPRRPGGSPSPRGRERRPRPRRGFVWVPGRWVWSARRGECAGQ
ncbi:hypothetical protein [Microvirga lupini]|uniref:hypothetical protein n=1 Tax=Microvirga lupini TaxID=420324 RepID=UPI003CCD7742